MVSAPPVLVLLRQFSLHLADAVAQIHSQLLTVPSLTLQTIVLTSLIPLSEPLEVIAVAVFARHRLLPSDQKTSVAYSQAAADSPVELLAVSLRLECVEPLPLHSADSQLVLWLPRGFHVGVTLR